MKEKILMDNPDFVEQFNNLTGLEDVSYFYHVTPNDANEICDEGLFLVEKRLSSTTIEMPQEFKDDPIEFCLHERGEGYRKNASVVILGIPTEDVKHAIEINYSKPKCWNEIEPPEYVIPPQYVAGFIDTDTFELVLNEKYDLLDESNIL